MAMMNEQEVGQLVKDLSARVVAFANARPEGKGAPASPQLIESMTALRQVIIQVHKIPAVHSPGRELNDHLVRSWSWLERKTKDFAGTPSLPCYRRFVDAFEKFTAAWEEWSLVLVKQVRVSSDARGDQ